MRLLGLDDDLAWFGVLTQDEDTNENKTYVTSDEVAFDSIVLTIESEVTPPVEFAAWIASTLIVIDGWPEDW